MNQQELKRIDDLNKQLKELNKHLKTGVDFQHKVFSNTNKNTMLYEMVKGLNSITESITDLVASVNKLTNEVHDIKGKLK